MKSSLAVAMVLVLYATPVSTFAGGHSHADALPCLAGEPGSPQSLPGSDLGFGFPGGGDLTTTDVEGDPLVPTPRAKRHVGTVTIPVYFHVINQGPGLENGDVSDAVLQNEIGILNASFSGATGGASSVFRFALAGITHTTNAAWYGMKIGSKAFREAGAALRQGGVNALNFYTARPSDGRAGFSTFPWSYSKYPDRDGVVIRDSTLPGGPFEEIVPPGDTEGDWGVHEVGHWLGLLHTFAGGCNNKGDYVDDTPSEQSAVRECTEGLDTCRAAGLDPIHNFMAYTQDTCKFEFTPGQVDRINAMWVTYRT